MLNKSKKESVIAIHITAFSTNIDTNIMKNSDMFTHPSWHITGVLMYSGKIGAAMNEKKVYITHAMITAPPTATSFPIARPVSDL